MIEEVIEPFLVQQGLVQRTPRGRILASGAYRVLGLNPPAAMPQLDLLSLASIAMTDEDSTAKGIHVWPIRVYFEDTDAGGVVYHGNYLKFAERARTELMRGRRVRSYRSDRRNTASLIVVRNCSIEFIAPARLDDALEVRSRITTMGGASFTIRQEILRPMSEANGANNPLTGCRWPIAARLYRPRILSPARLPDPLKAGPQPYKSHITVRDSSRWILKPSTQPK